MTFTVNQPAMSMSRIRIDKGRIRRRRDGVANEEGKMSKAMIVLTLVAACLVAGCDRPLTSGEKGAAIGAAAGTGIGLVTGGSFGAVVGAGLIGGAVGYLGGTAIGDK
jgi:hypothetical protein